MPPQPILTLPKPGLPDINLTKVDGAVLQTITPTIIWIAFVLCLIFVITATAILRWHWRKYTLNTYIEKRMTRIYLTGVTLATILLLVVSISYTINYPL